MHAEHLEAAFGVGPHTISVPRLRNADDIDAAAFTNGINDEKNVGSNLCFFKKAVIIDSGSRNIYIDTADSTVFMLNAVNGINGVQITQKCR